MQVHLATADFNGLVWHMIRRDDGSWTPPGNVSAVVGNPGSCFGVRVSANSDELHLVTHTIGFWGSGQTLWHTVRSSNGAWTPFVNLNSVLGNPGGFIGFKGDALAVIGTDLHLGALTSDIWGLNGTIWHAIRHTDGTWTPIGNVNSVVGHPGSFSDVAIANVAGELQLVGSDSSTVWHAIRHADGSWTPFEDLMAAVGNPGMVLFDVALTTAADPITNEWKLHLAGVGIGGIIWYTIRDRTGQWTPLENLNEILGGGPFASVGITGTPEWRDRRQ
jgi:hypothetical protein